jgi:hypothetical protein
MREEDRLIVCPWEGVPASAPLSDPESEEAVYRPDGDKTSEISCADFGEMQEQRGLVN